MNMISSLAAFIYCATRNTHIHDMPPHIGGDWLSRWSPLQAVLESRQIPIYLASSDKIPLRNCPESSKFQISASVDTKERLRDLLSLDSLANTTSVLVAGCYAETLITDVALTALQEGYDTFVIWDRVWAISEPGLEASKARLLQAGAVPTSVDQVLHRWS